LHEDAETPEAVKLTFKHQ